MRGVGNHRKSIVHTEGVWHFNLICAHEEQRQNSRSRQKETGRGLESCSESEEPLRPDQIEANKKKWQREGGRENLGA